MRWIWMIAGTLLVLVPALGIATWFVGITVVDGGHGLGEWCFLSTCAVSEFLGTLLCAWLVRRSRHWWTITMTVVGVAVIVAFLACFGFVFVR